MVADLDGSAQDSRIFLAAPIALAEIEELFAEQIVDEEALQWSEREGVVLARADGAWARWCSRTSRWQNPMPTSSRRR